MMRVWVSLGLGLGLALGLGACGGEDCEDDPRFFLVHIPPARYVSLARAPEDAGRIEEVDGTDRDASDRTVRVVYGNEEEWSALPCAEACSRARDLGLTPYRVVTSCARSSLSDGSPVVRCYYAHRECQE